MSERLKALITGASGGIGAEFARVFARKGHDLVLVARGVDKMNQLADELAKAHGVGVRVIAADLGDAATPERVFEQSGPVDFLVNNAGYGRLGRFAEGDSAAEMGMVALNIGALTHLSKLYVPGMVARKRGRILNVASTAAFSSGPFMAVYYASKAYVLSLSVALSLELRGSGVTVTCLCPGPTRTEFDKAAHASKSKLFRGGGVMDAGVVAEAGYRAMMRGKRVHIPGLKNKLLATGPRFVSRAFAARIAGSLQRPD